MFGTPTNGCAILTIECRGELIRYIDTARGAQLVTLMLTQEKHYGIGTLYSFLWCLGLALEGATL